MQPSGVQTVTVPQVGTPAGAARLAQAGRNPGRALIRNTGGAAVLISFDSTQLVDVNNLAGIYELPPGQSDAFVLAPSQSVFAVSSGGAGKCSVHWSEAIPIERYMES